MAKAFDPACRQCKRLAGFLHQVSLEYPHYHARPVPAFGDAEPQLLVVGLAPGMHGANATGRPFTGDHAGILLYEALYQHGFSNRAQSLSANDGLQLQGCLITNAVKCLPPNNKPLGEEVKNCRKFLTLELDAMPPGSVILALGTVAHRSIIAALGLVQKGYLFAHAAEHELPQNRVLLDSYHCSRYNTQTKRLTASMFHQVFKRARTLIDDRA